MLLAGGRQAEQEEARSGPSLSTTVYAEICLRRPLQCEDNIELAAPARAINYEYVVAGR